MGYNLSVKEQVKHKTFIVKIIELSRHLQNICLKKLIIWDSIIYLQHRRNLGQVILQVCFQLLEKLIGKYLLLKHFLKHI